MKNHSHHFLPARSPSLTYMEPALNNALDEHARLHSRSQPQNHNPSLTTNSIAESASSRREELTKHDRGWRRIVRSFTPSWFSVTMGTGIVSILLHNFPFPAYWLRYISYVLFALNCVLFILFTGISLARYTLYPRIWTAMIRHPAQSLFIGTFPMGLATIVNMIVFVCVPAWGGNWWKVAWGFWWIDIAVAITTCFYLPFIIMAQHHHSNLRTMTAAWLLPIVSTIVASASGGIVASILPHPSHALITLIVSYIIWGIGVPLAMCVLVIYFLRLTTQRFPAKEVIVSTFLPLGPLGQGGFAAMQLGHVARTIFAEQHVLPVISSPNLVGEIFYTMGFLMALILWGFGLVWFFFACASIWYTYRHEGGFPFNMGWWGFTFPLGVYAICTVTIGQELPSMFFRVLGAIISVAVVLLWILVSLGTMRGIVRGEIFVAPCLKDVEKGRKKCKEEGEAV